MADALKTFFSRSLVERISASMQAAHPAFATKRFVASASRGLDVLELMARARHIADALAAHLPGRYADAIAIVVRSLGPAHASDELEGAGMAPFFYLPHVLFVATRGLEDFDASMAAQHALTQRFTCEFSIRPFLERHPEATLAVLRRWARDPSPHVRRLVSEGTRPRLPWAPRVAWLEKEPERLLPLLEMLRDDPASVVRRSVANHLNDLSKTRPDLVCETAARWLEGATPERRALVTHALRSAVKRGHAGALSTLGYGAKPRVQIDAVTITPARVAIGGAVEVSFTVHGDAPRAQQLAVDLTVHFVKARGTTSPKVFKVGTASLARGASKTFTKRVSLAVHTTRKPHPGRHVVEVMINGAPTPLGAFEVLPTRAGARGTA